jgi:hypothetical protein
VPAAGRLGSLPQTPVTGPPRLLVDFNMLKRSQVTERIEMELRWEVFNLFNTVNFGMPENNIFSANFGRISQTAGAPRLMQVAMKLNF